MRDGGATLSCDVADGTMHAGHYWELLDRAFVADAYLDNFVGSHPVLRNEEGLRHVFERAQEALAELYLQTGACAEKRTGGAHLIGAPSSAWPLDKACSTAKGQPPRAGRFQEGSSTMSNTLVTVLRQAAAGRVVTVLRQATVTPVACSASAMDEGLVDCPARRGGL